MQTEMLVVWDFTSGRAIELCLLHHGVQQKQMASYILQKKRQEIHFVVMTGLRQGDAWNRVALLVVLNASTPRARLFPCFYFIHCPPESKWSVLAT